MKRKNSDGYITFTTGNTDVLRISSDGNVGIGTEAPSTALDVLKGDATVSGTLNVTGGISGTLSTAYQPNITSVGTLSSLDVSGGAKIDVHNNDLQEDW